MKIFQRLFLLVTLFLVTVNCYGQILDHLSYNPYLKSHTFFDEGSHKISDKNNAWCKGAGLTVFWQAKPKVAISAGYGLGFIDSLLYEQQFTKNATFHQLDINAVYSPLNNKLIQPGLFIGYAFNYIPQLKNFSQSSFGTNLNLGYQIEIKLKPYIDLRYASAFGVSLSDNIRYNFKNELGLVYNLTNYKSKSSKMEIQRYQQRIEQDLEAFDSYNSKIDSLSKIAETIASKTIEIYKLKETISNLSDEKNVLIKNFENLEKENRLLQDSLSELHFLKDSITSAKRSEFYLVDSIGAVQSALPIEFSSGYYVAIPNYLFYTDVTQSQISRELVNLGSTFIVYHNGYYAILSFLTDNSNEVRTKWRELGQIPSNFRIYKF